MHFAGQAAAQSEQPTHFSSPVSSKRCIRWRPRKRGYTGVFSSGYWIVTVPSGTRANTVARPRRVMPNARYTPPSPPGSGPRSTSITESGGGYGLIYGHLPTDVQRRLGAWGEAADGGRCPSGHDHQDRRDQDVQGGERQQDLPAERHELVVAEARQRSPNPDEED